METFKLEGEYIQLNALLKAARWVPSGGVASLLIADGQILLNKEVETQKRKKIRLGDTIEMEGKTMKIV